MKNLIIYQEQSSTLPSLFIGKWAGLLESIYQHCLIRELRNRKLRVDTMVIVALHYKGEPLDKDYIIDILVEDEVIIELKSIEKFSRFMKPRSSAT